MRKMVWSHSSSQIAQSQGWTIRMRLLMWIPRIRIQVLILAPGNTIKKDSSYLRTRLPSSRSYEHVTIVVQLVIGGGTERKSWYPATSGRITPQLDNHGKRILQPMQLVAKGASQLKRIDIARQRSYFQCQPEFAHGKRLPWTSWESYLNQMAGMRSW